MLQPGEITSADRKSQTAPAVAGLFVVTFLALFFGAGLEIQGILRARQERIESEVWPAVTARVDGCSLDRYSRVNSQRSASYKIRCTFSYSVNGIDYLSRTKTVGSRQSSFWNVSGQSSDAMRMQSWAEAHKKGSLMVLHYDAANPANISLAGADIAFRTDSAAVSLAAARQVGLLAAALVVASLIARKLTRPASKP
jgi:hypothetical protein